MRASSSFSYPFHLITGNGLGVAYSSYEQIGDFLRARSFGAAQVEIFINSNGNVTVCDHEILLQNQIEKLNFGFVYNLAASNAWRFAITRQIKNPSVNAQSLTIIETDGHETIYLYDALRKKYIAPADRYGIATISYDAIKKNWRYFHPKTRHVEIFDEQGLVICTIDAAGNETTYTYDDQQQLCAIFASSGAVFHIERGIGQINLYRQELHQEKILIHTYILDAAAKLVESKPVTGTKTAYYYDEFGRLARILQDDLTEMGLNYFAHGQLKQIQIGADEKAVHVFNYLQNGMEMTDASGVKVIVMTDANNRLQFVKEEQGIPDVAVTAYDQTEVKYNGKGQVEEIEYPDHSCEKFEYQVNGLISKHITRDGQLHQFTYSDNLLLKHSISHVKAQAPLITRSVYDKQFNGQNAVLRFVISPAGRVTEYLYDAKGRITGKREYLDNLFLHQETIEFDGMCAWVDEVKKLGGLVKTALTTYVYDSNGCLATQRDYTVINWDGSGCSTTSMSEMTITERNSLDQITKQNQLAMAKVRVNDAFAYDGNNELTKQQIGLGTLVQQDTQTQYEKNIVTTILANQSLQVNTLNAYGSKIEITQKNKINCLTKQYIRSSNDELTSVILPDKTQYYLAYDRQHEHLFTVSNLGYATETLINRELNCKVTTQHEKAIDLQLILKDGQTTLDCAKLQDKLIAQKDIRIQAETFDSANRPLYFVNALHQLTEFRYDGFGNQIAKIEYADTLNHTELERVYSGKKLHRHPNRQKDKIHSEFYDLDGVKTAEQDVDGYITLYKFDGGKNLKEKLILNTPDLTFTTNFNELKLNYVAEKDARTFYFNDAKGQCRYEIDAEGYITENTYHPNGKKATTIVYANKVNDEWLLNPINVPAIVPHANDHYVEYFYDELNRLEKTVGPFRKITTFIYDKMNKIVASTVSDDSQSKTPDQFRSTQKRWDAFGRLLAEANPFITEKFAEIDGDGKLSAAEKANKKEEIWANQSLRYEYLDKLKISETDPQGNKTLFYYDNDHRLIFSIAAGGVIKEFSYNGYNEILKDVRYAKRLDANSLQNLQGGLVTLDLVNQLHNLQDTKRDAITQYKRNKLGQVIQKIDPENHIYEYQYDNFGRCTEEKIPTVHGEKPLVITHQFDKRGNEIQTQKQHVDTRIDVKVTREFNNLHSKLSSQTDELGHITRFSYNRLGLCEEIGKIRDDQSELIVAQTSYDAFSRPTAETDAVGAVTIHEYLDANHREIIHHPDNTQTTIEKNIFGDTIAVSNALNETNKFSHAPDGTIRTHTNPENAATQILKDLNGRLVAEINALGSERHYDYQNNDLIAVTSDSKALQATEKYSVDAFGNREKITNANQVVTKNEFSRNNNKILSVLDPDEKDGAKHLNLQSAYHYSPIGKLTHTSQGDKKVHFQTSNQFDALNRCIKEITDPDQLNIARSKEYNNSNQIIREVNERGFAKLHFYDDLGRKAFTFEQIDAMKGRLLGWQHDDVDNIIETRIYSQFINLSDINQATTASLRSLAQPVTDARTQMRYDCMKRERFQLSYIYNSATQVYEVAVEEIRYDLVGRESLRIHYATTLKNGDYSHLTTMELEQLVASFGNSEKDHVTRKLYDKAGRPKYLIDADGYVTERNYNANGDVTTLKRYKTPFLNYQAILAANDQDLLQQLNSILVDTKNVAYKHYIYDGLRRRTHKIDEVGQITQTVYDLANNITKKIRFKKSATNLQQYELCVKDVLSRISSDVDSVSKFTYDAANRLKTSQDALGNIEKFSYDKLGNNTSHTDRNKNKWHFKFDTAKRKTHKIAPESNVTSILKENDQLVASENKTSVVTNFVNDNAGNVTTVTQGLGLAEARSLETIYDGLNNKIGTIMCDVPVDDPTMAASFLVSPTLKVNLTTSLVRDTHGNIVAEKNKADQWSLYVYDSQGRRIYEVEPDGAVLEHAYNAFDKVIKTTRYDKRINIQTSNYSQTGVSAADIAKLIIKDEHNDRNTTYRYDKRNNLIETRLDEVFCYSDGEQSKASPLTTKSYDYRGSCTAINTLIKPGVFATDYFWYDNKKRIIAEVKYHAENQAFLTYYERDGEGNVTKKFEFANAVGEAVTLSNTPGDLLKNIKKDSRDRVTTFAYNKLGKCKQETLHNVDFVTVELQNGLPVPTRQVGDLSKHFEYDAMQKRISITFEDGNKIHEFYDTRGYLCARTDVGFTPWNEKNKVIPLTSIGVDAFGNNVRTTRHASPLMTLLDKHTIPSVAPHVLDRTELSLFDVSGTLEFKQDAEGNLFGATHTATGKLARQFTTNDEWVNTKTKHTHIDETRLYYDAVGMNIQKQDLRDNKVSVQTFFKYNSFHEYEAESSDNKIWKTHQCYDRAGRLYADSRNRGMPAMICYNLAGHPTLTLKSPRLDLQPYTDDDFPTLLNIADGNLIQRTENRVDFNGQLLATKAPFWAAKNVQGFPTISYERDRWSNVSKEINSLGKATDYRYGMRNELLEKKLPETIVRDRDESLTLKRPTSLRGYTKRGAIASETDALNNSNYFKRDEAENLVQFIDEDGVAMETNHINIFNEIDETRDGRNILTSILRNNLGLAAETITAQGKQTFSYNADGLMNKRKDQYGFEYLLNYERGNVTTRLSPLGAKTSMSHDRNDKVVTEIKPDGGIVFRKRDYFGNMEYLIDLSKVVTTYETNFMKQITKETALNYGHGEHLILGGIMKGTADYPIITPMLQEAPESKKSTEYVYEYGLEIGVIDHANNRIHTYLNDSEGRRFGMKTSRIDNGLMLGDVESQFNELGWITTNKASVLSITGYYSTLTSTTDYDSVGNRRYETDTLDIAGYARECRWGITGQSRINTYTRARRAEIINGIRKDGKVDITVNQGVKCTHLGGYRIKEEIETAAGFVEALLGYDASGMLSDTIAKNGVSSSRRIQATANSIFNKYCETLTNGNSTIITERVSQLDADRREIASTYTVQGKCKHSSTSLYSGGHSAPIFIFANDVDDQGINTATTSRIDYIGFEDYVPSYALTLKTRQTTTNHSDALLLYDVNGFMSGKKMTADEHVPADGIYQPLSYFEMTPENAPLYKLNINAAPNPITVGHYFFRDIQNTLRGQYTAKTDTWANLLSDHEKFHKHLPGGVEKKPEVSAVQFPQYVSLLGKYNLSPEDGTCHPAILYPTIYPAMNEGLYFVKEGDTLELIAMSLYGDKAFAQAISKNNGFLTQRLLRPGLPLLIPQHIANTNHAGNINNIQQFLSMMQGSILPYVPTPIVPPKNHHNLIKEIAMIVATGLAIIAASYLAPAILSAASGLGFISSTTAEAAGAVLAEGTTATTTTAAAAAAKIAAGVSLALTDAAKQGLSIAFHQQNRFSGLEVVDSALSGSLGMGPSQEFAEGTTMTAKAVAMLKMGQAAVEAQLVEMGLCLRSHFDPNAVVTQMSAMAIAAAARKIPGEGFEADIIRNAARNTADAALGSALYHTSIDAESVAMQSFNDEMDGEISEKLQKSVRKDAYVKERERIREETHVEANAKPQSKRTTENAKAPPRQDKAKIVEARNTADIQRKMKSSSGDVNSGEKPAVPSVLSLVGDDYYGDWNSFMSHPFSTVGNLIKDTAVGVVMMAAYPLETQINMAKAAVGLGIEYSNADASARNQMLARGITNGVEMAPFVLLTGGTALEAVGGRIASVVARGSAFVRGGAFSAEGLLSRFSIWRKVAESATEQSTPEVWGNYRVERELPRDPRTQLPSPDSSRPHSQIGEKHGSKETYTQAREWGFDANGKLVHIKDIDFTDHGRPELHPNPHQHRYIPNPTGGTMQRSRLVEPLKVEAPNILETDNSLIKFTRN